MAVTKFFKTALLVCVTAALSSFSFAQESESEENPLYRNFVIIDIPHTYDLNPHTAAYVSEAQIFTALYEGLFSYHPVTLEPIPAICESYKISRDKKRWTFTLRKDAKFSDGIAITAQTFRDSWIKLLSEHGAPFASMLDCITGAKEFRMGTGTAEEVRIEVRDDFTLVVRLDEPAAHLPKLLCHHAFAAVSPDKDAFSGAFAISSYTPGNLVLAKNENYHSAGEVKIPGITIIQSDDTAENSYLFNTGRADWISGNAESAQIINPNSIHVSAEFGTTYLFFKIKNSPWDKPEFRNALLEAIPYDKLRAKASVKATTLVYPLSGYPEVKGIDDYDPVDAAELMKDARAKYGIEAGEKIPLIFAITPDDYVKEWAELLKAAWEPLGVELTVQTTSFERYNPSIAAWNADLFTYSWIGDFADPLAFLELFRGDSTLNVANYKNPDYDALLSKSATAEDSTEQYKYLSRAEQLLLDDGMLIPVLHAVSVQYIDLNSVGGWQTNALDLHPLKYIYLKQAQTRLPNLVRK